MSLFTLINGAYSRMSPANKRIGQYILDQRMLATEHTIGALASAVGVSNATITRFCLQLGFGGYPEFRRNLVRSIDNEIGTSGRHGLREGSICDKIMINQAMSLPEFIGSLNEDAWLAAEEYLLAAERVMVLGSGQGAYIAELICAKYNGIRFKMVAAGFTVGLARKSLEKFQKRDVLIVLNRNRGAIDELQLLSEASSREIISIQILPPIKGRTREWHPSVMLSKNPREIVDSDYCHALTTIEALIQTAS